VQQRLRVVCRRTAAHCFVYCEISKRFSDYVGHKLLHALPNCGFACISLGTFDAFDAICSQCSKDGVPQETQMLRQSLVFLLAVVYTPGLPPDVEHEITEAFLKSATIQVHGFAPAEQSMGAATSIGFPFSQR
jgi:hypothetical protein